MGQRILLKMILIALLWIIRIRDRFRLSKIGRKIFEREFSPTNEKAAGGSGGAVSPPKALGFQTL